MVKLNLSEKELLEAAKKAAENSYSPYSHYKVGCAVKTKTDIFSPVAM